MDNLLFKQHAKKNRSACCGFFLILLEEDLLDFQLIL